MTGRSARGFLETDEHREPTLESLLDHFRSTFEGCRYKHRNSTTGDRIASYLFEDLAALDRSAKLRARISSGQVVVNTMNRVTGKVGRRGDGTFGERVPTNVAKWFPKVVVARGAVADVEIGVEMKTLATKMLAQIGRVITDLKDQSDVFRRLNPRAIRIALVGVNHSDVYTGVEGRRSYNARVAPSREAAEIVRRIEQLVRPHYDELVILRYKATNRRPFPFYWVKDEETRAYYVSALVRISAEYESRF